MNGEPETQANSPGSSAAFEPATNRLNSRCPQPLMQRLRRKKGPMLTQEIGAGLTLIGGRRPVPTQINAVARKMSVADIGKPSTNGKLVNRLKLWWQLSTHHFAMTAFTSVQQ
jgi:hypothetical protein